MAREFNGSGGLPPSPPRSAGDSGGCRVEIASGPRRHRGLAHSRQAVRLVTRCVRVPCASPPAGVLRRQPVGGLGSSPVVGEAASRLGLRPGRRDLTGQERLAGSTRSLCSCRERAPRRLNGETCSRRGRPSTPSSSASCARAFGVLRSRVRGLRAPACREWRGWGSGSFTPRCRRVSRHDLGSAEASQSTRWCVDLARGANECHSSFPVSCVRPVGIAGSACSGCGCAVSFRSSESSLLWAFRAEASERKLNVRCAHGEGSVTGHHGAAGELAM